MSQINGRMCYGDQRLRWDPQRWSMTGIAAAFVLLGAASTASAGVVNIGFLAFDVTSPTTAQFDIQNVSGPNSISLGDPDFPVQTTVLLSDLTLTVKFTDGSNRVYLPADNYFTLGGDGESLDGSTIAIGGTSLVPSSAVLTGTFSPASSLSLADGSTTDIVDTFTTDLTASSPPALADGDAALIVATTGGTPPIGVPEPTTAMLLTTPLLALSCIRRRGSRFRVAFKRAVGAFALLAGVLMAGQASAAVTPVAVTAATLPSSGVAGLTEITLTTTGLPAGVTAANITLTLAPTCAVGATGPVAGETTVTADNILSVPGTSLKRVRFLIPAATPQETAFVSITGTTAGGTAFASTACAITAVTKTNPTLNACVPTSSMGVVIGSTVTAYVPNGSWSSGGPGIRVVPIEPVGTPTPIATTPLINSCAANPATGAAICTGNDTSVYLVNGTTSPPILLNSSSNAQASFSGGTCNNCGVAVNALTNTADISMGYSPSPSSSAIQVLNLTTQGFSTPVASPHTVSENISVDPTRNLVLSASESNFYDLFQTDSSGQIVPSGIHSNNINMGGEPDSSGEDCSTGIVLAPSEFGDQLFLADLSQISYPTPTTWTAPSQNQVFPEFGSLSAGPSSIVVAPGTTHLAVVAGEFSGNLVGVIQLPATSGSGTPAVSDYVVFTIPSSPDGLAFANGYDPHTTTAYTSPNNGKAYALLASWASGAPAYLAKIDLAAALAALRSGGHTIDPSVDLIGTGIVSFIKTN